MQCRFSMAKVQGDWGQAAARGQKLQELVVVVVVCRVACACVCVLVVVVAAGHHLGPVLESSQYACSKQASAVPRLVSSLELAAYRRLLLLLLLLP